MAETHTVWLIDEGHTGHRVQSEGIIQALENAGLHLSVARCNCKPRLRGFFRPAARELSSRLPAAQTIRLARQVSDFEEPEGPAPSFIISSGGRTAFASRALALKTGAPNVFVGNPKPFPHHWFSVVLSPVPLSQGDAVLTGVVPSLVTPQLCQHSARAYWNGAPPANCWTLLIGGPSRNHKYDDQDWRDIAAGVNALSYRHNIRWLISTSRRTGAQAEAILAEDIAPESIEELVLYNRAPKRVVQPFLGAGARVFVTRDSLTMLSEAIMSGKPVAALLPRRVELDPENFMAVVLRKYQGWTQYHEVTCHSLAEFDPGADFDCRRSHQAGEELAAAARELISVLEGKQKN